MKNTINILFAGIVLFITTSLCAQSICQIKHFSTYNGLTQRTVTDIAQDPKGFIWFSTWNGLNKFDGYTFKNYKAYPGDGCTLTSNRLLGIVPNQHCNIWCQTYDYRVYLFDSRHEKFIDILQPLEKSNNTTYIVRKIYTLPKGISWITCDHGAFRIDEEKYKEGEDSNESITFYSPADDNLAGETIFNILQDSEGDEWILTNKGVHIIGKKSISEKSEFRNACENNNKMYLISADNRLAIFDFQTKEFEFKSIPYPYSQLNSIQNLGDNMIGIGTDNDAILFFAKENRFKQVSLCTAIQSSSNVQRIFKDTYNELWIFSNAPGVMRYNPATDESQYYQTPSHSIPKTERNSRDVFFEDSQGTVWIVPHMGSLSYYDRNSKQLKTYYTDINNPNSQFAPVILNYFIDKQSNFWFANTFEMNKVSFFPNACQLASYDNGFETRAFLIDKQKHFWAASKKGFIRIFNPDRSLKGYLTMEGNVTTTPIPFSKNVYCFMQDYQGDIWLGTKSDGVYRLRDKGNGHFQIKRYAHEDNNPYSLSHNSVYSIYQDSHKRIWVGTHGGGLNLLQETSEGEVRFLHNENQLKGYTKNKFSKIRIIKEVNQTMLVGTTEGLITFSSDFDSAKNIKFFAHVRMPNIASSLSSNDVTDIYTDSRKNTYVLTFTGGVNQIVSNNLLTENIQFKSFTKQNGLASDLVLSMIEDSQKKLWVISENAIASFNPENGSFNNYDRKYLQREINFSEAIPVLLQDQLIVGTEAGIVSINLTLLNKSNYTPPIAFTGLRIQGIQQDLNIDDLNVLELKPYERNVTFEFAALDYVEPTSINYAYRLKGLESKWNEVDNSRRASYINLPPGTYKLQIRSTNSDGMWTDNTRNLTVEVIPTFWETYWAILFYFILFMLFTATTVYIILYIYKLRHRISLEQQLTNIKLRFFTDISHELRTPLTLITSPVSEVLEDEPLSPNARKHLMLVHKNTERMLRLINQILDFRKIENKKMRLLLEETEIIVLLERIMDSFRLMAEEKNIKFNLQTGKKVIHAWIDRDKFEKIVFNLISNAFKYTPANKSITVCAGVTDNKLTISIIDEGIGIDFQKQQNLFQRFETLVHSNILQPSSGIGLSLAKELIELHQGHIHVSSQVGIGSEFIVTLPLEKQLYEGKENTEFILNDSPIVAGKTGSDYTSSYLNTEESILQKSIEPQNKKTDKEQTTILIVEDNIELRSFLYDILSGTYNVIQAGNGQEGLEHALQYMPDFIISDVMMPVMDGLDMVKAIKDNQDICHIPIILLSAKSSLDDRISGLEHGIDDYITKPFSSTYLKTRIKHLLSQREQLQELYLKQWSEKQKDTIAPTIQVEPEKPQITSFDEQFIQRVMKIMEAQMENSEFTVDGFAQELGMGRTVFYQKIKGLFGLSPIDFIREMRIKRAKQLIESGEYNISSIAYMTGFNDPKYFSKCFKKKYGMKPSEFKKEKE